MISFLKPEEQHQHKNGGGWVANTGSGHTIEVFDYDYCDGTGELESWSREAEVPFPNWRTP